MQKHLNDDDNIDYFNKNDDDNDDHISKKDGDNQNYYNEQYNQDKDHFSTKNDDNIFDTPNGDINQFYETNNEDNVIRKIYDGGDQHFKKDEGYVHGTDKQFYGNEEDQKYNDHDNYQCHSNSSCTDGYSTHSDISSQYSDDDYNSDGGTSE